VFLSVCLRYLRGAENMRYTIKTISHAMAVGLLVIVGLDLSGLSFGNFTAQDYLVSIQDRDQNSLVNNFCLIIKNTKWGIPNKYLFHNLLGSENNLNSHSNPNFRSISGARL